jgi:hypothetical protein
MSSEDGGKGAFEENTADLEAFEAPIPAGRFCRVAYALGLLIEPESLSCLRRRLLPEFRFFLPSCPGERLSRDDRIIRLQRLHNAATALPRLLPPVSSLLPRKYLGHELLNDQFGATIGSLADDAALQIQRLRASRDQAGRPRLEAFRQLGEDLIRVYRTIGAKKAVALEWDGFCRLAVVACRCLESRVPAVVADFPESPRAMRDNLQEVWNQKYSLNGAQRSTSDPGTAVSGREGGLMPCPIVSYTRHGRPRSVPMAADSERLLDSYFEPRLGYFKLKLKRRHARDLRKGLFGPEGLRNVPDRSGGVIEFSLPNGWTLRLTYYATGGFDEEPSRRKAGNADVEFIPPPHKRRSTDRGIVARITAQVSGEQQS